VRVGAQQLRTLDVRMRVSMVRHMATARTLLWSAPLSAALVLGCANTSGNTDVACRPLSSTAAARPAAWTGTVFTIVMENHSRGEILGNPSAPFINGLAGQGAVAAGYHDSYVHPSEPNYLWMVAGENFGILDDNDPGPGNTVASQSHLADQIEQAGLTWKTYQENMGAPCGLSSHGAYAVKHNPFAYFSDINGWDGHSFHPGTRCTDHIVDFTQLAPDLASGSVADYVFITPNLVNDMHDGSVATGDGWLASVVPGIMASPRYQNGGALFVLWDEGSSSADDPPFIAISPNVAVGTVSHTDHDTSAFLKTVQSMLGVEPLPCAAQPDAVPTMDDLFTVSLARSSQ
jgi:hypothetical protein